MRSVAVNSTDQTIRVFAFDSNSAGVTGLTTASGGLAVNVVVHQSGRRISTTNITGSLTTRDVATTHKDFALTEIGAGEYEIDLPDSYFTAAQEVSATIAATAVTGRSYSNTIEASAASTSPLDAAGTRAALGLASANLDTQIANIPDASGIRSAVGLASANLDTQLAYNKDELAYALTVLTGLISNGGTTTNTFQLTRDGSTYTVTVTGVDANGNRTGQTLAKT